MDNHCTIDEIVGEIKKGKLSIYCGAGISFNSGLPVVNQLLDYLFKKLNLSNTECNALWDSDTPFENIMEKLLSESELTEFQNIFAEGTPNINHLFIAKLIKNGFVKIVYTTNFDLLIEKALVLEGLELDKDFKVYKTEKELREINWNETSVKIIKIHGCASAQEEMAITLSQLASNRYLDLRTDLLTQIFSSAASSSVLVLGYSCSDFDLVPIIASLKNPSSQIFYVEHNSSDSKIEPIRLKIEKNPFKRYKGKRLVQNTDAFIKNLIDEFQLKLKHRGSISETSWRSKIDAWFSINTELSGKGFKHHIAARLLYAIGENQTTIAHAGKAIKIAFDDNNAKAYSSELGTMGMAHNRLGNFEEALRCFEKALPITEAIGYEYNISVQLQAYANILHHVGRNADAIQYFKQALEISRANGNKYTESNILGNITNCHIALDEYLSARYCVSKALEISGLIGNKQAESSQLGMLAQIQTKTGQITEALKTMLSAIEIKTMLADNNELCKLYLNLTGIYIMLNGTEQASQSANKCLLLARKIANQNIEKMILFVISSNNLTKF